MQSGFGRAGNRAAVRQLRFDENQRSKLLVEASGIGWRHESALLFADEAMKTCLFCTNRADSLEHVIPQWIFRRVSPEMGAGMEIHAGHFQEGSGTTTSRKHLANTLCARLVCQQCNNGWMSDLETRVIDAFGLLIEPSRPVLFQTMLESLGQKSHLVARWSLKTALLASFAMPGRFRLPRTLCAHVLSEHPPSSFILDVALSELPGVAALLLPGFMTINGGQAMEFQSHARGDGFHFVIQVNHLLVRVVRAPGARFATRGRSSGHFPMRLHPIANRRAPKDCWYADALEFANCLVVETSKDCAGEHA